MDDSNTVPEFVFLPVVHFNNNESQFECFSFEKHLSTAGRQSFFNLISKDCSN